MIRTILSCVAGALVVIGLFYVWKQRRSRNDQPSGFVRTFSMAGAPDQVEQTELDDLENSKMVSEGSQFGVQYFNEFMYDE